MFRLRPSATTRIALAGGCTHRIIDSQVSREISKPRADVETVNGPGCAPKRRPSRQGWRSKLGQRHTSRGDREAGGEAADDVHRGLEQIAGLNECERFPRPR